jgi:hypothetical protein
MNFLTIFYFLFFTSFTLIFGGDFHLDKKQDELRTLLEYQNSTKSKEEFETFETAGTYLSIVNDEKRNESLILFKQVIFRASLYFTTRAPQRPAINLLSESKVVI